MARLRRFLALLLPLLTVACDAGKKPDTGDDTSSSAEASGEGVSNTDSDGDGLTDDVESRVTCSDPLDADTDADLLSDWEEIVEQQTFPFCPDTDGDGVEDGREVSDGTSPTQCALTVQADCESCDLPDDCAWYDPTGDFDGDGLTNHDELTVYFTNPTMNDTDGDGWYDNQEAGDAACHSPLQFDSDGDGVGDYDEHQAGTRPCEPDTDKDGLDDSEFEDYGTDPLNEDTDGDGLEDGFEVNGFAGCGRVNVTSDPLDIDSDNGGTIDGIEYRMGTCWAADIVIDEDTGATSNEDDLRYYDPTKRTWHGMEADGGFEVASLAPMYASSNKWNGLEDQDTFAVVGATVRDYYPELTYHPSNGGPECSADLPIASIHDLLVLGIDTWTPTTNHQQVAGYWSTDPIARGVHVQVPWDTAEGDRAALAGDDVYEVGYLTLGGTRVWESFTASVDETHTTGFATVGGKLAMRVTRANIQQRDIRTCDELNESASHQGLRLDVLYAGVDDVAAPPPSATDALGCTEAAHGSTDFTLLPSPLGHLGLFPMAGSTRYSGSHASRLTVHDFGEATRITARTPAGETLVLTPAAPMATLATTTPLHQLAWHTFRGKELVAASPSLSIDTVCVPSSQGATIASYGMSVDALISAANTLGLDAGQNMLPRSSMADAPLVRARPLLPTAFHDGPSTALLQVELAGTMPLGWLRLTPQTGDQPQASVSPTSVAEWSFDELTPVGSFEGTVVQAEDALVVTITHAGPRGAAEALPDPLVLQMEKM